MIFLSALLWAVLAVSRNSIGRETEELQLDELAGIPVDHPRLWWNHERIERARRWFAVKSVPHGTPSPLDDAIRYICTGDRQYARRAIDRLAAFVIPDRELGGVASDKYRWADWVPCVFDWCYDQMTAEERRAISTRYSGYVRRIMTKQWGGPAMPGSNYFWGYTRNEINWAIAIWTEDPENAHAFLRDALVTRWQNAFVPRAVDGFRGGVAPEGSQYGRYLLQYPTIPFETLSLLGRDLYQQTNFYQQAVYNLIYSTTSSSTGRPGASPRYQLLTYGDDEVSRGYADAAGSDVADFMYMMAKRAAEKPSGQHAREWIRMTGARPHDYVAAVDEGGPGRGFADLPLDYYAPGSGYLYAQERWGAGATKIYLQLGSSGGGSHGHFDFGSYSIWSRGSWLTKESTGYSAAIVGYGGTGTTPVAQVFAHNTIAMAGKGMSVAPDGPPVVTRLEVTPDYVFASSDLTKAYRHTAHDGHPERDNARAGKVVRDLVYVRQLGALVVLDRLKSGDAPPDAGSKPAEAEKACFVHFPGPPVATDHHFVFATSHARLNVFVLRPPGEPEPAVRVVNEKVARPDASVDYQYRLEIVTKGDAQQYLLHVLQAREAVGGEDLCASVVDGEPGEIAVLLRHPRVGTSIIRFHRGAESKGGAFGLSADPAGTPVADRNFGSGLMAIEASAEGVRWLPQGTSALAPGELKFGDVTSDSLTATITPASGGVGDYRYGFERAADSGGAPGYFLPAGSVGASSEHQDHGLLPGRTYWYRVQISDSVGAITYAAPRRVTTATSDQPLPTTNPAADLR